MTAEFDPVKYHDTYNVKKLIEDNRRRDINAKPAPPKLARSNVIDLVAALQLQGELGA